MASTTGTSTDVPGIPHIHLLCMQERFSDAFEAARQKHTLSPSITRNITVHNHPLSKLPSTVRFDTIVSPANSYGRLDGAFDDAISHALAPTDDYYALTRAAQRRLYEQWRGFAPPGSCTLVHIPDDFHARSRNVWGARRVALCPTMRVPDDARWDREIVYECVWSLLCAVDNHNRAVRAAGGGDDDDDDDRDEIRSILMTPLGTGIGAITPERWASQAVLALKHFHDACANPDKWSAIGWTEAEYYADEVEKTWKEGRDEGKTGSVIDYLKSR
ncbi:hypothetical protein ACRE_064660 [Hapsidospora chrysogenum ATCC 11550]|uniref:Macro domain-like protein n=1 Tax=Hapsidospora chrysogenum (strain ATCC 11550 / CBS 779.69 / DSM 880 / IAM 14645 / JCM 23072 / IMI 49137) TaxID=857340 RepID=A0A086T099_HAPC1|nr:hypothetical protein ACRE_064660 [Hapsidospora chrysogenum ATCC 11550]